MDIMKMCEGDEIVGTIEMPMSSDDLKDFGIRPEAFSVEFNDGDNYDFED